jgi:hypothetical protein
MSNRSTATDAVTAGARRAAQSVRVHRSELLILGGTVAFVLVVGLLSLAALLG